MLKKLVNEAYFTLSITTTGPLLIRSGGATISGPDMTPILTYRNHKQEVFLPGSSLKGVFRSHSEKIVCSLRPLVVCYPFSSNDEKEANIRTRRQDYRDSCGAIFNQIAKKSDDQRAKIDENTEYVYRNSCPACRLFGSTAFIGRISIGDAYLVPEKNTDSSTKTRSVTEQRDGVGIDRLTGGASHGAKFELEVVSTGATFETNIHIRNFELWQLGMLFVTLQDMADGLIRVGSGRSRGLGQITASISEQEHDGRTGGFVVSSIRGAETGQELWGMGRWLNDNSYGTRKDDSIPLPQGTHSRTRNIRSERIFTGEALRQLQDATIDQFVSRINNWSEPAIDKFLTKTAVGEEPQWRR